MHGWSPRFILSILLLEIAATTGSQAAVEDPTVPTSRVRSNHPVLLAAIARAGEQSRTFRRLVETVNMSDGLVYVEPGGCRHGIRACLIAVKSAGQQRVLFIKVDIQRNGRDLSAAIGHELQHAVEVLSEPAVTDFSSLYFFYRANADQIGTSGTFETKAAVKAGEDIREEIRTFERAKAASGRR